MSTSVVRRSLLLLASLITVTAIPAGAQAAADQVYGPSELDELPRFASKERTARLLAESYPSNMRRMGVTGMVQLQFVVDAQGRVESSSIKVMSASAPQLAQAAQRVAAEIEFTPALIQGRPVRTLVLLPIVYK
ncbi:MAG: energy transducer TonB [Gemmatimonadales bacterium]|nr:energy transducer TonB [Gemmatimonadales bacterium]